MTPAMTPEEWADRSFKREGLQFTAHDRDGSPYECGAYGMAADGDEDGAVEISDSVWHGAALRALAALCLYGQPFGFTHEDVRMLRKLIAAEEQDNALVYDDERYPIRERMPTLADRIEALLPPKP